MCVCVRVYGCACACVYELVYVRYGECVGVHVWSGVDVCGVVVIMSRRGVIEWVDVGGYIMVGESIIMCTLVYIYVVCGSSHIPR